MRRGKKSSYLSGEISTIATLAKQVFNEQIQETTKELITREYGEVQTSKGHSAGILLGVEK